MNKSDREFDFFFGVDRSETWSSLAVSKKKKIKSRIAVRFNYNPKGIKIRS